ncbi:MAG: carboxymuconolactone decarboxylase family protein [Hyphomicrobiales bacterium]|nr:carboxymuconolactone decarboxylase family protein [Hyphomicrobiales bacterium]
MFTRHDAESAPAASRPEIDKSIAAFGFFPILHRIMAEAPATYEAYNTTFRLFRTATTLTPLEQQIVMMTANYENRCHYCTAGHSLLMTLEKAPPEMVTALRDGAPLADSRLEALRAFTRLLIEKRGHVGDDALRTFLAAGFTQRQALEVLTGLAAKLLSNFTNALAHTELDPPVVPWAWTHPDER